MTSIDMEFPQVPRLSPADEIQARRALRSNRLLATGLLALMIVIAITTRFVPSPGWLVQLVPAGAEARGDDYAYQLLMGSAAQD